MHSIRTILQETIAAANLAFDLVDFSEVIGLQIEINKEIIKANATNPMKFICWIPMNLKIIEKKEVDYDYKIETLQIILLGETPKKGAPNGQNNSTDERFIDTIEPYLLPYKEIFTTQLSNHQYVIKRPGYKPYDISTEIYPRLDWKIGKNKTIKIYDALIIDIEEVAIKRAFCKKSNF